MIEPDTYSNDPFEFVHAFFDAVNREVEMGIPGVQELLEGQIHGVAVGLLHSMLPPLVHANIAAVKISESTSVIGNSGAIALALGTADVSNSVVAGAVADKVRDGIDDLRSDADYARGVNSIAW